MQRIRQRQGIAAAASRRCHNCVCRPSAQAPVTHAPRAPARPPTRASAHAPRLPAQNTAKLADDLQDIQHIMRKNIQEVLDRGEKLESALSARGRRTARGARRPPIPAPDRTVTPLRQRHLHACASATATVSFFLSLPPSLPPSPADVSRISSKLVSDSKQFKFGAKRLNAMDRWRQLLPCIGVALLLLALLWWRFG